VSQEVKDEIKQDLGEQGLTLRRILEDRLEDEDGGAAFRSEVLDTRPHRNADTMSGDDFDGRIDRYHGLKLDQAADGPDALKSDDGKSSARITGVPKSWLPARSIHSTVDQTSQMTRSIPHMLRLGATAH
jgi:hypothetical protein